MAHKYKLTKAEALEGERLNYRANRDERISDADLDRLITLINQGCQSDPGGGLFVTLTPETLIFRVAPESQREKMARLSARVAHETKDAQIRDFALGGIALGNLTPARSLIADLVNDPNPKIRLRATKTIAYLDRHVGDKKPLPAGLIKKGF